MAKTHQLMLLDYQHIKRNFSIASSRGSVIKDLWVSVDGTNVSYRTVVNGIELYDGPSSLDAAKAYNDPGKIIVEANADDE